MMLFLSEYLLIQRWLHYHLIADKYYSWRFFVDDTFSSVCESLLVSDFGSKSVVAIGGLRTIA